MNEIFRLIVVPVILLGFLALSGFLTFVAPGGTDHRLYKGAGCLLGIGVFALVVILNLFSGFLVFENVMESVGLSVWLLVMLGIFAGFITLGAVHLFLGTRVISFFIAYLTSVSLVSLYLYFSATKLSDVILIFTVSQLVGLLAYGFLRPKVVYVFTGDLHQKSSGGEKWECQVCRTINPPYEEFCIECDNWQYRKVANQPPRS